MEHYQNTDSKHEPEIPPPPNKEVTPAMHAATKENTDVVRDNNPYFRQLTMHHLEEVLEDKEKRALLERGNVSMVLHPFYEMLLQNKNSFDEQLWNDIKKHPERYDKQKPAGVVYCEQWIIREMNRTVAESSEKGLSIRYWRVMEMAQEYEALLGQRLSPDTRVIILPKFHKFTKEENAHGPAIYQALIDIMNYGSNERSFFIESEQWSNGSLNGTDTALMQMLIPEKSRFLISGGYIGQCMDNLLHDLRMPSDKKQWNLHVSVEQSTPVMFFDDNGHPGLLTNLPPAIHPTYQTHQKFSTMEDVLAFVKQNEALNRYIVEATKNNMMQRKRDATLPSIQYE